MADRISLIQYQLSLLIEAKITELFEAKIPFTAKFVTDKLREQLPAFEINHGDVRRTLHTMLQDKNIWHGFNYTYVEENWQGSWAMTYRPVAAPIVKPFTEEENEIHKWVSKNFPNVVVKWMKRT